MMTESYHKAKSRYFDPYLKRWTVKLLPGEYYVCRDEEVVATTLGSCISACIWDVKTGIGGMNHFMLAQSELGHWGEQTASTRFGNFAMEYLINELLKQGASRNNLRSKIFGGASMNTGGEKIGGANINFAISYLQTEKIPLLASDTGSDYARKIYFDPNTGEVKVKSIMDLPNDTIAQREKKYARDLEKENNKEEDVVLF